MDGFKDCMLRGFGKARAALFVPYGDNGEIFQELKSNNNCVNIESFGIGLGAEIVWRASRGLNMSRYVVSVGQVLVLYGVNGSNLLVLSNEAFRRIRLDDTGVSRVLRAGFEVGRSCDWPDRAFRAGHQLGEPKRLSSPFYSSCPNFELKKPKTEEQKLMDAIRLVTKPSAMQPDEDHVTYRSYVYRKEYVNLDRVKDVDEKRVLDATLGFNPYVEEPDEVFLGGGVIKSLLPNNLLLLRVEYKHNSDGERIVRGIQVVALSGFPKAFVKEKGLG